MGDYAMNRATKQPGPIDSFLDIETRPTEDPEAIAEIEKTIKPPGNMKLAETIAAWAAAEKPAALIEQVAKTALDGTYGSICAIGVAFDDEPTLSWVGAEREVLEQFFRTVRAMEAAGTGHNKMVWIGHNVRSFDLRFLWQRAVIHGLRFPLSLRAAIGSRPWDDLVIDTMVLWNPERDRRISLARLCRALGVESPKSDLTGAGVAAAWAAGEFERIKTYVQADVVATRACYRRMSFAEV